MRYMIAALACALTITCHSQSDWSKLFQADPVQAEGYFIVDLEKSGANGLSHVEVDIIGSELLTDGSIESRVVETLLIDLSEDFFAHLDFSRWTTLSDPFRIHYQARGLKPGGTVVIDVQQTDGGYPWPEVCRETCVSNLYAYTLVAYSNGAQAFVELQEGTIAGDYTYIYVKASDWNDQPGGFKNMFTPSFFGIGVSNWSELEIYAFAPGGGIAPYSNELKRYIYPFQDEVPPSGARDYTGTALGTITETVYAVKRGKGPWQQLYVPTSEFGSQELYGCGTGADILRPLYNGSGPVLNSMATYNIQPLACEGFSMGGGGLSWGSGYGGWCPFDYNNSQQNDPIFTDLPEPVAEWVTEILGCANVTWPAETHSVGSGPNGTFVYADVANVIVSQWKGTSVQKALSVPVNKVADPRLWPTKRTKVPAGLYDFTVILNDGTTLTRFVEFGQETILQADFASFTTVNIYPVPVVGRRFVIDFELTVPTSITLTVVNNMGHQFYNKQLEYELPGKHKHAVRTDTQWPNGLYHAIFQFSDGSSSSASFTVSE